MEIEINKHEEILLVRCKPFLLLLLKASPEEDLAETDGAQPC